MSEGRNTECTGADGTRDAKVGEPGKEVWKLANSRMHAVGTVKVIGTAPDQVCQ